MENDATFHQQKEKQEILEVFCYQGQPKNVIHIWKSVIVSNNVINC